MGLQYDLPETSSRSIKCSLGGCTVLQCADFLLQSTEELANKLMKDTVDRACHEISFALSNESPHANIVDWSVMFIWLFVPVVVTCYPQRQIYIFYIDSDLQTCKDIAIALDHLFYDNDVPVELLLKEPAATYVGMGNLQRISEHYTRNPMSCREIIYRLRDDQTYSRTIALPRNK